MCQIWSPSYRHNYIINRQKFIIRQTRSRTPLQTSRYKNGPKIFCLMASAWLACTSKTFSDKIEQQNIDKAQTDISIDTISYAKYDTHCKSFPISVYFSSSTWKCLSRRYLAKVSWRFPCQICQIPNVYSMAMNNFSMNFVLHINITVFDCKPRIR